MVTREEVVVVEASKVVVEEVPNGKLSGALGALKGGGSSLSEAAGFIAVSQVKNPQRDRGRQDDHGHSDAWAIISERHFACLRGIAICSRRS